MNAFSEAQTIEELQNALRNAHRQLKQAKDRNHELVRVVHEAAKEAMLSLGGVKLPPKRPVSKKKSGKEVALWHLTDWQGAKVTTSYNSQIMVDRVMRFCDKAAAITQIQRADHAVDDVVILLGGDMIEGLFNFPTQPFEVDASLFLQISQVSQLLMRVVQFALHEYSNVQVIGEWGNHGRIGSKRDAVPKHDNADRITYELARVQLVHDNRVTWEDSAEDVQRLHIPDPTGKGMGYRAVVLHGDEVGRNGFASLSTIANHVTRWKSGSYPWEFRDAYVGHYHQHQEFNLADGQGAVFFTGSTESDNRYAGVSLAAAATPSQRLHFVDPVKGRVTAQYKVFLDE